MGVDLAEVVLLRRDTLVLGAGAVLVLCGSSKDTFVLRSTSAKLRYPQCTATACIGCLISAREEVMLRTVEASREGMRVRQAVVLYEVETAL